MKYLLRSWYLRLNVVIVSPIKFVIATISFLVKVDLIRFDTVSGVRFKPYTTYLCIFKQYGTCSITTTCILHWNWFLRSPNHKKMLVILLSKWIGIPHRFTYNTKVIHISYIFSVIITIITDTSNLLKRSLWNVQIKRS